jgi:hypothetical protein
VLVAAIGFGACAESVPPFELTESRVVSGAWADPVEEIRYPDEATARVIQEAGEAAIAACMAERGFEYRGGDFPWSVTREQAQYVYGGTDPESAKVNGLKSALWMASGTEDLEGEPEPGVDYYEALNGTASQEARDSAGVVVGAYDPDSCLGRALDEVTPKWPDIEAIRAQADEILLVAGDVGETYEVKDGYKDWSGCMAASGYEYPDPWSMSEDYPQESPTAEEKDLAVVSANCMHSSGLLRTWSRARAQAAWDELQRVDPELLTRWEGLVAESLKSAEASKKTS